jgi:hypothetical protein
MMNNPNPTPTKRRVQIITMDQPQPGMIPPQAPILAPTFQKPQPNKGLPINASVPSSNQSAPQPLSREERIALERGNIQAELARIRGQSAPSNSHYAKTDHSPAQPNDAPEYEVKAQEFAYTKENLEPMEETDALYKRVMMPSNNKFYNSVIYIRPFNSEELIELSSVRSEGKLNQTLLMDIFDRTIKGRSVREFHLGDFQFIFYWLRLNSYTRTPMTFTATSKYGNKNKITIKSSDIQVRILEDLEMPENLTYPRLKDAESFENYLIDKDEKNRALLEKAYSYAQYVIGNSVEEKLSKFLKLSPDDMVDILRFDKLISDYGISERITYKDIHFEAKSALQTLEKDLKALESVNLDEISEESMYDSIADSIKAISSEIARIKHEIKTTGEAAASSETIIFKLRLENFFPENMV